MAAAPTVILGAGLSGLSVARALLRRRPGASIVLVDRRTNWERDRTWCFWDTLDLPDAALATARWSAWNTVDDRGAFTQHSQQHPYVHLPADRFYEASLLELSKARNVDLQTGTRVLGVRSSRERSIVVNTSRGELHATAVVDAMGGSGPLLRNRDSGSVELSQRFVGLEVEVEHPVFDPSTATLMDFRVPDSFGGVRFMYVLPFTPTRALVEDTSLGGPPIPAAVRRRAIAAYLEDCLGAGAVEVVRTERGVLPMTTYPFQATRGPGLFAAGQAAGAARPSSGYAFARAQRHASALAACLVSGAPAPSALGPWRRRVLDAQFLRVLRSSPQSAPDWFMTLSRDLPGDVFARFMSDTSSTADEARVVQALAKPHFLAALAGTLTAPRHLSAPLTS